MAAVNLEQAVPTSRSPRLRNVAGPVRVVQDPVIVLIAILAGSAVVPRVNPLPAELAVRLRKGAAREPQGDAATDHFRLVNVA